MDTTYARMKIMKEDCFKPSTLEEPKHPLPTLVKFNGPVLIGGSFVRKDAKIQSVHVGKGERLQIDSEFVPIDPNSRAPPGCIDSNVTRKQADEIFDKIIPPREWLFEGRIWRQTVSTTPAGKAEVIALAEKLKTRMKKEGGKKTGISAVRRELYSQCFDEIVRQVTVNCTERGLLLLRVRDESNHVLRESRKLFESSVAYGLKKRLSARTKKKQLTKRISEVKIERDIVKRKGSLLEEKLETLTIKYDQEEKLDAQMHYEEEQTMRIKIEGLKVLLEETINPSGVVRKKEEKVAGGGPNAVQLERLRLRALRREAETKAKEEADALARAEAGLPPLDLPPAVEGKVEGEAQGEGEEEGQGQPQAQGQILVEGQLVDPNQGQALTQAPSVQPNTSPPQSSAPQLGNSTPPKGNSTPPKGNSTPPKGNSTPPKENSTPPKGNSTPPQGNSTPPQAKSTPPQESSPAQGDSEPEGPAP